MLIRWLGAFNRCKDGLDAAIDFEMTDRALKCAEPIDKGRGPQIWHPLVGMLVKSRALVRKWESDVWSVPTASGRLKATRWEGEAYSFHREAWVRPEYCGIVIKSRSLAGGRSITKKALLAVKAASEKWGLPIYRLHKGGKLEEVIICIKK